MKIIAIIDENREKVKDDNLVIDNKRWKIRK